MSVNLRNCLLFGAFTLSSASGKEGKTVFIKNISP